MMKYNILKWLIVVGVGGSERQLAGTGLYYHPSEPHQNVNYLPGTYIFSIELGEGFFSTYGLQEPPASLMFETDHQLNTGGLIGIMKEHYCNDAVSKIGIEQLCLNLLGSYKEDARYFPEWEKRSGL